MAECNRFAPWGHLSPSPDRPVPELSLYLYRGTPSVLETDQPPYQPGQTANGQPFLDYGIGLTANSPPSPPGRPLRGLPDGSTPSPMASRPSIGTKFNSVQRGRTNFLLGKSEGLTHSADGVVTPHRGGAAGLPGQLGQAGASAGQRRTQSHQGVLRACVPVCMAGAQGWTGGSRGSARRVGCPGGPGVVLSVSSCPPQDNTQPSGTGWEHGAAVETATCHQQWW